MYFSKFVGWKLSDLLIWRDKYCIFLMQFCMRAHVWVFTFSWCVKFAPRKHYFVFNASKPPLKHTRTHHILVQNLIIIWIRPAVCTCKVTLMQHWCRKWETQTRRESKTEGLTCSHHPRCLPAGQQQQQQPEVQVRRRGHNLLCLRAHTLAPLALQHAPLRSLSRPFNSPAFTLEVSPTGSPLFPHHLHPHLLLL